jgi:ABC-type phosphate transport system auxiliary subunit
MSWDKLHLTVNGTELVIEDPSSFEIQLSREEHMGCGEYDTEYSKTITLKHFDNLETLKEEVKEEGNKKLKEMEAVYRKSDSEMKKKIDEQSKQLEKFQTRNEKLQEAIANKAIKGKK